MPEKVEALSEVWLPFEAADGIGLTNEVAEASDKRLRKFQAREELLEKKAHVFQGQLPQWKDFAHHSVWLDPKMCPVSPDL